ncbi:MAG: dihydrolipoyllysine-residue acetyltransferase [Spongiibacteraceae bacterium]
MATQHLNVPDIGGAENVEVIEICVKPGDKVNKDDSLIVLESDKASMEIPAPVSGTVKSIQLKVGDKVSQGSPMLELDIAGAEVSQPVEKPVEKKSAPVAPAAKVEPEPVVAPPAPTTASAVATVENILVPDIGTSDAVEVIEVSVTVGTQIAAGDTMVVLESDKASMEIPAPKAGIVRALKIKVGDKISSGAALLDLETTSSAPTAAQQTPAAAPVAASAHATAPSSEIPQPSLPSTAPSQPAAVPASSSEVYAGPAVRRLAREMGIDLTRVPGSGPKNRIQKDDVKRFVKELMENRSPARAVTGGAGIPAVPAIDFAQFGPIDTQPLTGLHKAIASNMHRAWLNVPHVTQWDDADITELESFRETLKGDAEKRGVKLSPLPFLLKACVAALKMHPKFNASLHADGEHIVYKQYFHIGIAVDTPAGLMVPVLRDVDKKSVWELAAEAAELAQKAKDRKLKPAEMQGGCFSISSLGNIGGLGFTPIVNTPEVAILGVSKLTVKPIWNGSEFVPRKMLPLSLSYDHRALNGGDAGRFFATLNQMLGDIRRLVL